MQDSQYINILEDNTVIFTGWKREIGDRVMNPTTNKMVKVKHTLTRAEYNQCLENRKQLIVKYFKEKAIVIGKGKGFPINEKLFLIKRLHEECKEEPLMTETFAISMTHFT